MTCFRSILGFFFFLLSCISMAHAQNPDASNFDQGLNVDIGGYNQLLAEGYAMQLDWVKDPASIVRHLTAIPPDEIQNGKPVVIYESINIDADDSILVVIRIEQMLDDSVAAERLRFRLGYVENKYQITEIKSLMQCRPGHGQTDYSGEYCK